MRIIVTAVLSFVLVALVNNPRLLFAITHAPEYNVG
jgi:hypothetical protein